VDGNSSLKYVLLILGFGVGIIGMLGAFVIVGPLVGIAIFWVVMAAIGYILYRLLTEDTPG
jgi:hypothetical protein